jgi:hypothetical protein
MRLTIEPTNEQVGTQLTITLDHPSDDLTIDDMRRVLLTLLSAWGYRSDSIKGTFGD